MSMFPWTYDQLQRYAVLRLVMERITSEAGPGLGSGVQGLKGSRNSKSLCVLDVGGAAPNRGGTGFWLPAQAVLSETSFTAAEASGLPAFIRFTNEDGMTWGATSDAKARPVTDNKGNHGPIDQRPANELSLPPKSSPVDLHHNNHSCVALEISPDVRVFVADVSACREPGFVQASGMRLPFKNGAFDIVSAFDVLEHIPQAKRKTFIDELARVAADVVLLSCPVNDPAVERAEAVIAGEIERLYGVRHAQLREHQEMRLPEPARIDEDFAGAGMVSVSFGYGGIPMWLAYQAFRSSFLGRLNSDETTEAIDRWWTGQPQSAELQSPFYRRFWLASKTRGTEDLAVINEGLTLRLKAGLPSERDSNTETSVSAGPAISDDYRDIESVTRRYVKRDFVTAVVVTKGAWWHLVSCLDSLLTQQVDFDLEVDVWDFSGSLAIAQRLEAGYPAVCRFSGCAEEGRPPVVFPALVERLKGNHFLLIDEHMVPGPDAISRYLALSKEVPGERVLSLSAPWRGGFPREWEGSLRNQRRKRRGLAIRAENKDNTTRLQEGSSLIRKFRGWVIGDALFFPRIMVNSRKSASDHGSDAIPDDALSIFLWEFE